MKLIVGLGNPGKEYEKTRHNVGFMVLDTYCKNDKFQEKFNGLYCIRNVGTEKIIFLKPLSFMNLSGNVVSKYANYYKIDNKDILIIRDDLDLYLGEAKIKYSSSSGGNNGIKSIIEKLQTKDFGQLKIGINLETREMDAKDFVLGKFNKKEFEILDTVIKASLKAIDLFIDEGIDVAMNKFNGVFK